MVRLLQEYVTRRAEISPDSAAIVTRRETISYQQVEERSNQVARILKEFGCVAGDRVCFLSPKSPAAIVSLLGILKAGCAYVPLDPASPASRLAKIVASCEPRLILIAASAAKLLNELVAEAGLPDPPTVGLIQGAGADADGGGGAFGIAFGPGDIACAPESPLECRAGGESLAHILFTSGSTGAPKGVMIKHSNVIHFVEWAVRYFGMTSEDRVSGHPPLHFDLSTFDMYGAFAAGAQLYPVPQELNLLPNKLADFIREMSLTQWFSVPSALNYLAKLDVVRPNDFPSMKRLLWCGEVFPTPALRYWMQRLPHVSFTNLYGPTEATIASSYYTVPRCPASDSEPVPIGVGCEGEELLVLDDELNPAPMNEVGHLYIRGVGLSPGYWRDPEKTEAAFLRNPRGADPDDHIYRTGDLAKAAGDGMIYFLGRADSQIKSRGYRIELGEIETALNALAMTQDCAVVAVDRGGFEGAIICCAYVQQEGKAVTRASLSAALGQKVPGYMIPSRWMALPAMPLNVNGKYDRKKLRDDFLAAELKASESPGNSQSAQAFERQ
jgi:amino acid adenylation domain-containing protein